MKVRMVLETGENSFGDPDKAARFDLIAAVCCAEDGQAHPIRAGSAGGDRRCSVADDRRYVMRPAPSVVRATSVFARAERSR
jgi:hypothetical protein